MKRLRVLAILEGVELASWISMADIAIEREKTTISYNSSVVSLRESSRPSSLTTARLPTLGDAIPPLPLSGHGVHSELLSNYNGSLQACLVSALFRDRSKQPSEAKLVARLTCILKPIKSGRTSDT
ncbi:hypothetical protein MGYG_08369 [Nannizzia gypsea CBS 118893]|uniref:Uncharacterized protein n=1 Tax=Arthroderma gypseum (strain ATCC MYA-4604 / CBS 118893) TaxID=535722 RepID=E4V5I3_ARTGP|nr:hypothetical protein MGYG_08369 [Nannizzia gypsea CBS 118893]EFR05358.1 hypothetical protein MGYG_08369 [Nannizzia gypsea CBS 118893]